VRAGYCVLNFYFIVPQMYLLLDSDSEDETGLLLMLLIIMAGFFKNSFDLSISIAILEEGNVWYSKIVVSVACFCIFFLNIIFQWFGIYVTSGYYNFACFLLYLIYGIVYHFFINQNEDFTNIN
jgi:hypothetical protein